MKIVKTLIAATLSLTALSAFAATEEAEQVGNEIVSTQAQPVNSETSVEAAAQPTTAQPTSESAAEEVSTPTTAQPAQ